MNQSSVYRRYPFLSELGSARRRDRKMMIDYINPDQMEAISVVARHIVEFKIPIMERDYDHFQEKRRTLRIIAGSQIPFRRKRQVLLNHHKILPRLLREFYLRHTIRQEMRSREE